MQGNESFVESRWFIFGSFLECDFVPTTAHMLHRCVTVQRLTFCFSSSIFCAQLLQQNDLCNKFFRQFHRVRLKTFGVAVMVQRPEEDSSEGSVEELLLQCSPFAETPAAPDALANISLFEGTDGMMWKFVFLKRLLGMLQPNLSFF